MWMAPSLCWLRTAPVWHIVMPPDGAVHTIRLNGEKILSASKMVGPDDVLTLKIGLQVKILKLLECGTHRGSFSIAQLLYEDLSPVIPKAEILTKGQQGLPDPHGKPDSRERLQARRLSGKE